MAKKGSRVGRVVKGTVRMVANVPAWIGYDGLKDHTQGVYHLARNVFRLPKPKKVDKTETFEGAVYRLNLTDKDIQERHKRLETESWVFAIFSIALFLYALYLLYSGSLLGTFIALAVSGMFGIKWLTCRFWMFQINERRLGCSLKQWAKANRKQSS